MDFAPIPSPRRGRTKQISRKGRSIEPVRRHDYDCPSDSDHSRFSRNGESHDQNVVVHLANDSPQPARMFDGMEGLLDETDEPPIEKPSSKKRGKHQQQNSLHHLMQRDTDDPLDMAMGIQEHESAEFRRTRRNRPRNEQDPFTSRMGTNMDRILKEDGFHRYGKSINRTRKGQEQLQEQSHPWQQPRQQYIERTSSRKQQSEPMERLVKNEFPNRNPNNLERTIKDCQIYATEEEIRDANTPTDHDTQASTFERQSSVTHSNIRNDTVTFPNLGLAKMNNGGIGRAKRRTRRGKTGIHMGRRNIEHLLQSQWKDRLVDSDDDRATNRECGDGWNKAKRRGRGDFDPTFAHLEKSGMAPLPIPIVTNDWSDISTKPNKKRCKSSFSPSTTNVSPSIASRRRTRRRTKTKVEGSNNDNAITIDDSSSDESSVGVNVDVLSINNEDVFLSQRTPTRATGDLVSIEVARIAIGKKVYKSKCALKFQLGTKDPYLLFVFSSGESRRSRDVKLSLKSEDLKEMAYFVADEEKDGSHIYDDNMSIIAFRIKPTNVNKLVDFVNWYDGEDVDKSETKYITIEVRDKDEFQKMLVKWADHPDLSAFYENSGIQSSDLDNYIQALVEDDKAERAKRRAAPRTRSKGKTNGLSLSENKVLSVFPFKVEEEVLQNISKQFIELSGNRLGVEEVLTDVAVRNATEDDNQGYDTDENNREINEVSARKHFLTIREDDKERLEPGQFLNDTLVDFWMSWISRDKSSNNGPNPVHFFTSHFLTTIEDEGPKGVESWTMNKKRTISIFEKKFIFVPVNGDLHWSLCVIVNPGLIMKAQDKERESGAEPDDEEEWPCILFLDSLRMHRKMHVAKMVMQWLNFEWNRRMKDAEDFIKSPFTRDAIQLVSPKVPYQENGCDCGVFVCRYAYNLYLMRNQVFSLYGVKTNFNALITKGRAFDFGMNDIARIRSDLKILVDSLTELYSQFRQKEKATRAASKRRENESKTTAQNER